MLLVHHRSGLGDRLVRPHRCVLELRERNGLGTSRNQERVELLGELPEQDADFPVSGKGRIRTFDRRLVEPEAMLDLCGSKRLVDRGRVAHQDCLSLSARTASFWVARERRVSSRLTPGSLLSTIAS